MSLVVGEGVSKSYSEKDVLTNVAFRLGPRQRIGLVGPNGEGKTTLLRIVGGMDQPTRGEIHRKKALRTGYLSQDPPALGDTTLWESLLQTRRDLLDMEQELHDLSEALAGDGDQEQTLERYGRLQTAFEASGGYDYETRMKAILTGLGFDEPQYHSPLGQLSGGQQSRAMLARLLVEEPDLLLLDEPTNHLDLDAVEWLEKYLQGYPNAALIVSHDRYFLDRVTDTTWEVAFGSLESYSGGYSEYLKKREQRFDERMKRYQAQQEYIARTEEFIRRNLSGQRTKEAQGRRTRLERFIKTEAMARPRRHETINIRLQPETRSGDLVLRATDLQAGYQPGKPIVSAERLELRRGRRLAVVGGNGTGKTTLLRTLLGQLPPLAGQVELGANVTCGYLSQTHENLRGESTVLDAMTGVTGLKPQEARSLLGSFHLSGDDAFKKVSELSGGQRSRVILAQLSALRANLLMLDEPTNHLDLPSREVLQEALLNYRGTLIFVSHDRYLVQSVATDLWAVEDGRVHRIHGQWEEYLRWRSDHRAGQASTSPERAREQHTRREDRREQRRQQKERRRAERRMEKLEVDIEQLESRVSELSDEISRAGQAGDLDAVHRLGEEFEKVQSALTESMDAWSLLGEQLDED